MASDNFSATNNPLASPWALPAGGWAALQSASGECRTGSGSDGDCAMRYATSTSLRSIITYASGAMDCGAAFFDTSGNGYAFTGYDTNVHIFRLTGGPNYSQVGSDIPGTAWNANDQLELAIDGNDLVYLRNSVEIARRTDSTFRTGLAPAVFIFDGTSRITAWSDGASAAVDAGQTLTRPGPGISPDKLMQFSALRLSADPAPVNDTSLQAALACVSSVTGTMTSMWMAALPQPGPGISPEYLRMFTARGKGAITNAINDTALAAALSSVSSVTAGLSTSIALQTTLAAVSSVTGALTTSIALAASPQCVSSVNASLTTSIRLQAAVAALSSVTAALSTAIPLQASLQAVSTLTAELAGGAAALAAALAAQSTVSASLTTAVRLASTLQATSAVTAALTTAIPLAAAVGCQSAVTGALTTAIRLAATLASQATVVATLGDGPTSPLVAALASQSSVIASLSTAIRLQASLASVSSVTATLTGGAAVLAAVLQSVSTLVVELTSTLRAEPFGPGIWDPREGQFASRRNPYVSLVAPHEGRLIAEGPVVIARFAWVDDDGLVRTIRTGDQRLGWVRQVFGPRHSIYADRGLRWIRTGLPVSVYVEGEFWARFAGGAQAGDTVYVSLLDGRPISGYAADALPTQWRVATWADPEELAVITTWE